MIAVVQRVSQASVVIGEQTRASIGKGLLLLLGIENADGAEDIEWLVNKIVNLRIFNDNDGVMNISLREDGGDMIVVSQFTLHASTRKGNRPSYIKAAKPDIATPLYERFVREVSEALGKPVQTGEFGADMQVGLVNDGPVTIIIDTKNRI
jgi:D-tyrosyl-tRNA(Tyr) deacylase